MRSSGIASGLPWTSTRSVHWRATATAASSNHAWFGLLTRTSRRLTATRGAAAPRRARSSASGEEERPQLEGERVPAEREELEQHHARIVGAEAREQAIPAVGEVGGRRPAAVGTGEAARRLVRRHERRERDDLGAAQVEIRDRPAALDEDHRLAGPSERAREPRRPLEMAEPEQVLAVEEDRPAIHGGAPASREWLGRPRSAGAARAASIGRPPSRGGLWRLAALRGLMARAAR